MTATIYMLVFALFYALLTTYLERKIAAKIQNRLGPVVVGIKGVLQPFADVLKLMQKLNLKPAKRIPILFELAPVISFVGVFASLVYLSINTSFIFTDIQIGIYLSLGLITLKLLSIGLAGIVSYDKFSFYGAFRAIGLLISYEIPLTLAIISCLVISGSLNASEIIQSQGLLSPPNKILFLGIFNVAETGGLLAWNIFQAPHLIISFVIFTLTALMASNRAPFDILEAESELVAGYHTEYGGVGFALFMLSEYLLVLVFATLGATLFLGGWQSALPNVGALKLNSLTSGYYWGPFWLFIKSFLIVVAQISIKWFLPRLRPDQIMLLCWKYLIPLSFINLLISLFWIMMIS